MFVWSSGKFVPRYFSCAALVIGLIGWAGSALGGLVWSDPTIKREILPGQVFSVDFAFENKGKEAVTITNFEVDCGCIEVAMAPGKKIAAGEKGVLWVRMDPEGRTGPQLKRVWIYVDGEAVPSAELTLEANIVEVFAFDPEELELEWKQAGPDEVQILTIRRVEKVEAEILGVESTSSVVDALLDSSDAAKGIWRVRVAPTSTKEDNEGVVFIRSNYPPGHPRTYLLLARVLKK